MHEKATTSQPPSLATAQALFDMHCHVDFCDDPQAIMKQVRELGLYMFANTTTPQDFVHFEQIITAQQASATQHNSITQQPITHQPHIVAGVGAHPWYIADDSISDSNLQLLEELIQTHILIGEIGLDFSPKHCSAERQFPEHYASERRPNAAKARQIIAFENICSTAVKAAQIDGRKRTLSIHAVQAADAAHDILAKTKALENCICIYHWFSGSGNVLAQAVHDGCYFSVNQKMLATRRGKSYAQQIPTTQLLLETDMPYTGQTNISAADITATLQQTLHALSTLRQQSPATSSFIAERTVELAATISANSQAIFSAAL